VSMLLRCLSVCLCMYVCYESGEYAAALFVCLWGVGDTKAKMAYEVFKLFFLLRMSNFPLFRVIGIRIHLATVHI
jgi:hypothetical protein